MQKVLFLTTAHHPKDDRIFFHQAQSLAEGQFEVKITSLCTHLIEKNNSIEIESFSILEKSVSEKIETYESCIFKNSEKSTCIRNKKFLYQST